MSGGAERSECQSWASALAWACMWLAALGGCAIATQRNCQCLWSVERAALTETKE